MVVVAVFQWSCCGVCKWRCRGVGGSDDVVLVWKISIGRGDGEEHGNGDDAVGCAVGGGGDGSRGNISGVAV